MIIVLSPAKTLDENPAEFNTYTLPEFKEQSALLIELLRQFSAKDLSARMKISDSLATLNLKRYATWTVDHNVHNAKPAILTFDGDVYDGLNAKNLTKDELTFAQNHLRILSGLYGVLRPLDLMKMYRLEMGTTLANARGKNLYAFWGDQITQSLNQALQQDAQDERALVNLASQEYFKAINPQKIIAPVITPIFEDWKDGIYKMIGIYAKHARGLMAHYAVTQCISKPVDLKGFSAEGYRFTPEASSNTEWVFRRKII